MIFCFQIKLQYEGEERVSNALERQGVKRLLEYMLDVPWIGTHDHTGPCSHCQMTAMWFQLAHSLMDRVFAKQRVLNPVEAGRSFGSVARNESLMHNRSSIRSGMILVRNFLYYMNMLSLYVIILCYTIVLPITGPPYFEISSDYLCYREK